MYKRFLTIAVILIAISAFVVSGTDEQKILTPELEASLVTVGETAVSPDGKWIAFTKSIPRELDEESGGSYTELYVMSTSSGDVKPFVTGKQRLYGISWCPMSQAVIFLANRGDGTQIYALPVAGGEARQLTHSPTSVSNYRWSPTGWEIAYSTRDDFSAEEKADRKAGRDMTVVETTYRYNRLHIYDLKNNESRFLTPAEYEVYAFNWSPDGKKLVFTASDEATTDASYMHKSLYTIDTVGGERELLCETSGKLGTPVWSPDGTMIAWNGAVDFSDASLGSVFVCKLEDGKAINLTGDAEYTAMSVMWLDTNTLLVPAVKYQHTVLFSMKADGSDVKEIFGKGPIFRSPSLDNEAKVLAVSASTAKHPNELFVGDLTGKLERVTHNNKWLEEIALGKQEVIEWTAEDGLKIQGVLIYPVNYEEGKRYPLVVQPHGGPESADLDGWTTRYSKWSQMLAGKGFFVLNPNYRGSTGRGVAYAKADHFDLGGKETQDVVDGIKYLIEKGYVDKDRVGSGGGSYGGYFSALAATKHSKHYAASIVFAGITDWYSFQGTSDIPIENANTHWNIPDWHVKGDIMWKASPVAYIANAETPTLICHGEEDLRVPLGQGQELFRALKFKGTPVEFVIYPRAGHGLRESQHRLDYAKRALAWYEKWLLNK